MTTSFAAREGRAELARRWEELYGAPLPAAIRGVIAPTSSPPAASVPVAASQTEILSSLNSLIATLDRDGAIS